MTRALACLFLLACAATATLGQELLSAAPAAAPAPAPLADNNAAAAPGRGVATPGLPSKSELAGLVLALANVQAIGSSNLGLDLDITCTPGRLTPSKRAPAVLQWPSARAVLVTAACVKNGTADADGPPCEGAITASQTVPAYSLPPRWEPSVFVTPACSAGLTLPFPGRAASLAVTPPGDDGGIEFNLLPATTLECDSIADLGRLGAGWVGGRGRGKQSGCRLSGPLVDPEAAVGAALAKLAEVNGVLGLA